MSTYHQMGNDTKNLIGELPGYAGAIASPVNDNITELMMQIDDYQTHGFDIIFDPQLYFPRSQRGHLQEWKYFPSDVDTADISSLQWWTSVCDRLVETVGPFRPAMVCSPAIVPKTYSDDYHATATLVASYLAKKAGRLGIRTLQTVIVTMADLTVDSRIMAMSSIISATKADGIYLVLVSGLEPRREYSDAEDIAGAMKLIHILEKSGMRVTVGFCSSDALLWKYAGATSCATGKFFNLRRFTIGRFIEAEKGGAQIPYWFEEALLGFLREPDLVRLQPRGMLSRASGKNPFARDILQQIASNPGGPWVGLGWRQYMYWFADVERRAANHEYDIHENINLAERAWKDLNQNHIVLDEPKNNGSWLEHWRRAIELFHKAPR